MTKRTRRTERDRGAVQTAALLGTYVPRQCGIATFTKDLRDALVEELGPDRITVLAMDDQPEGYPYPEEVRLQIPAQRIEAYRTAADLLNINQIDVAIVQHEYGIYGGADGGHILDLVRSLRMPVLTTLHTVLREPSRGQRAILDQLARLSDRLVVMSRTAASILKEVYGVPDEKIAHIPHGIPDLPFVDPNFYKDQYGVEGRTVLLTFGLLSPGKGIEVALGALPEIVERHPDVVYIVLGATHPNILRRDGEAYRHSLERRVDQLGLRDHVAFHNRFVSVEELCGYLGSADVYISPYPNAAQVTSGTLVYALGAGKAVVSTPYWYAEEMLAGGRGRLFPFGDSRALARAVLELLEDEVERHAMRKRAYLYCRPMVWKEVGRGYAELAREVVAERARRPRPIFYFRARGGGHALPDVNLDHLRRLTDSTGVLQHAIYSTPNRRHGYCTDDNARALVAVLQHFDLYKDASVLALADIYFSYLHHAFDPERGRFRNFMGYDRRWLDEVGSADSHGRALWSLGLAAALAPNEAVLSFATRLFNEALDAAEEFRHPRPWAFCLVGLDAYLRRFDGDTRARRLRALLAGRLFELFQEESGPDWPWCEEVVTYDNAKLPHALLLAGRGMERPDLVEQGLVSLEWLVRLQLAEDGTVSLIGNRGWFARGGGRARFDQQPIEAMALVEACAEAFRVTREKIWADRARAFLGWFLGSNDTDSVLYDYRTGGCRDGLHADGPNLNEGAESTLAWLIALLAVKALDHERAMHDGESER